MIQEKNIEEENKRRKQNHQEPRFPMYTVKDAQKCIPLFSIVEYKKIYNLTDTIQARFQDIGHILGSACIELFVTENGKTTKLVFSGDIGQRNTAIIQDPTLIADTDYLFMESTYGDRLHEDTASKEELLTKYSKETYAKGGRLFIPSFSVERTQELLYFFNIIIQK